MEVVFPTGIVEEFPCARTGKILSSSAMADILAIKTKIPGVVGKLPANLTSAFIPLVTTSIVKYPSFWSTKFESVNGELIIFVEIDDSKIEEIKSKRWRARLVLNGFGNLSHRIDKVLGVPAFWIEELEDGEMP